MFGYAKDFIIANLQGTGNSEGANFVPPDKWSRVTCFSGEPVEAEPHSPEVSLPSGHFYLNHKGVSKADGIKCVREKELWG